MRRARATIMARRQHAPVHRGEIKRRRHGSPPTRRRTPPRHATKTSAARRAAAARGVPRSVTSKDPCFVATPPLR